MTFYEQLLKTAKSGGTPSVAELPEKKCDTTHNHRAHAWKEGEIYYWCGGKSVVLPRIKRI